MFALIRQQLEVLMGTRFIKHAEHSTSNDKSNSMYNSYTVRSFLASVILNYPTYTYNVDMDDVEVHD